jgi:hypothetical protein
MAERDEDDFVTVASYSEVGEAALAQSVLDGAGIDSFLSGEEANILLPMSGARLQVRMSDAEAAREFLNTVPETELEGGTVAGSTSVGAALADNGDDLSTERHASRRKRARKGSRLPVWRHGFDRLRSACRARL